MHQNLIDVAWMLVDHDPGRPRQATLRRAVSTAYYAVFHAICRLCANELAGKSAAPRDWAAIYRSVDHGTFKSVREQDLRANHLGAGVHGMLNLIIDLQRDRHDADYNPEPFAYGRLEVRALINSAEVAIIVLDGLSSAEKRAFAVAMLARPRRK